MNLYTLDILKEKREFDYLTKRDNYISIMEPKMELGRQVKKVLD